MFLDNLSNSGLAVRRYSEGEVVINMDEAVAWGRKAVVACRASVEVRELLAVPTE